MVQNQNLDLDLDLEVHKALGLRQTSMMYDCEVRVLLFIVFFFTIVLCKKHLYSFQHFLLSRLGIESINTDRVSGLKV